jgi:hypothetical protein
MLLKSAVWLGLGFYALLSATDWLFTFALLRAHPGAIEANPLAAACLDRYGWTGLALFKTGGVLVFVGAVFLLARRRPVVAATLTAGGCAVLLAVTVYTHGLLCEAHRDAVERAQDAAWPKPKPTEKQTASGFTIPQRCWFASDPSISPETVVLRQ